VKELAAPLWLTTDRHLRCFHQQKPQQHIALLADVAQSSPLAAGLLLGNQSDITGDLLAAVKAFGSSDHQLVGQCRKRADSRVCHQPPRHRTLLHFLFQRTRHIKAQAFLGLDHAQISENLPRVCKMVSPMLVAQNVCHIAVFLIPELAGDKLILSFAQVGALFAFNTR